MDDRLVWRREANRFSCGLSLQTNRYETASIPQNNWLPLRIARYVGSTPSKKWERNITYEHDTVLPLLQFARSLALHHQHVRVSVANSKPRIIMKRRKPKTEGQKNHRNAETLPPTEIFYLMVPKAFNHRLGKRGTESGEIDLVERDH